MDRGTRGWTFIRTQISWKTVELWSIQFGYTSTKSSCIHQYAYIIIIVLFLGLKLGMRGWNIFPDLWINAYSGDRGRKRRPNSQIRGWHFLGGLWLRKGEERGVEFSVIFLGFFLLRGDITFSHIFASVQNVLFSIPPSPLLESVHN